LGDSANTTGAPVRPGDILLGKYQVEHVLGQGGMGVVVAAKHLELGELYAIKFLLPDAVKSQVAVSRFVREARAAARLHSSHVARVHDVGRLESGMPYMVMEHLVGRDLAQLLKRRGALPEVEAAALLLEACEAITEAHTLGIIHRDIKPSNLFLAQRRTGAPCLKVLDFGISKQLDAQAADQTKTGTMMGSLLYMSPEQMSDAKTADARSDIWSLGVVLYELTTGKVPFTGETVPNLIFEVLTSEPAPPSQVRPGLSAKLDEVVLRCLRKKPEQRYARVEELAAAMRAIAGLRSERPRALDWSAEEPSGLSKLPTDEVRASATTEPADEPSSLPPDVRGPAPASPALLKGAAGPSAPTLSLASGLENTETLEPPATPMLAAVETMPVSGPVSEQAEPPIASTQAPLSTTANRPPPSRRSGIALAAGAMVLAAGVGLSLYLRQPVNTKAPDIAPLSASTTAPSAPEAPAIAPPASAQAETLPAPLEAPSEQTARPVASAAAAPTSSASARAASSSRRGGATGKPTAASTTAATVAPQATAAPQATTTAPPSPPAASAKPHDKLW
jgi:serine/threonine protein kinase